MIITQDELNQVSMEIILHAGDARLEGREAINFARQGAFIQAYRTMEKAHENMVKAHQAQTKVIQSAMGEDIHPNNLLFAHAQDTLMTIMSELEMMKVIIELFECLTKVTADIEQLKGVSHD